MIFAGNVCHLVNYSYLGMHYTFSCAVIVKLASSLQSSRWVVRTCSGAQIQILRS